MPDFMQITTVEAKFGCNILHHKALDTSKQHLIEEAPDHEADVVVVGTGYAGQNAAIASHDAGASVLININIHPCSLG